MCPFSNLVCFKSFSVDQGDRLTDRIGKPTTVTTCNISRAMVQAFTLWWQRKVLKLWWFCFVVGLPFPGWIVLWEPFSFKLLPPSSRRWGWLGSPVWDLQSTWLQDGYRRAPQCQSVGVHLSSTTASSTSKTSAKTVILTPLLNSCCCSFFPVPPTSPHISNTHPKHSLGFYIPGENPHCSAPVPWSSHFLNTTVNLLLVWLLHLSTSIKKTLFFCSFDCNISSKHTNY